jgi:nickel/cobalt exporter
MQELLFFVASSFWAGAAHAATPGHGKTIAAAYIVGARGKPIDAVILGVFVTLSHTSGIVLVGVLASFGSTWLRPSRVEAYLAVIVGILVIALGLWMLWTQRDLLVLAMDGPGDRASEFGRAPARGGRAHDHTHEHDSDHLHAHSEAHDHVHAHSGAHGHAHAGEVVWHSHGFGKAHAHRLDVVTENRPKIPVLLALGVAGGLLPDPAALALLLGALSSGKVLLGLTTVVVFSLGFAATLVAVGIVAAKVGEKVLDWLSSIWMVRVQIATSLLIVGMGVVLTTKAASDVAALPSW